MLRHSILALSFLLVGCASTRASALVCDDLTVGRTPTSLDTPPSPGPGPERDAAPVVIVREVPPLAEPEPSLTRPPVTLADGDINENRFTVKGGYFGSTEDALDDGYILNVSWMRYFSKIFAMELEIGYLDADGTDNGVDTDVWSVPVMLNGRFNLPVWKLDGYGGLGIGTFYYDAEADAGATSEDDNGFLLGGNAFVGATFTIAEALALGLEVKYYLSDEISDVDTGLDAYAVMLTLGWSR